MREPLSDHALAIYRAAVDGARPGRLMDQLDLPAVVGSPLDRFARVGVLGVGKAAMAMAGELESRLGTLLGAGEVTVPWGYPAHFPAELAAPRRIRVVEAGHPVPDRSGVDAAHRALEAAAGAGPEDLLIIVLSGGGSALWTAPAPGIELSALRQVATLLLGSGADIGEFNTVRKHLSRIKGGRLAVASRAGRLVALVISDVVGDDLSNIASGPTVPDPTRFQDAVAVLQGRGLWRALPAPVRGHLQRGLEGKTPETPKPGDAVFERVTTLLLGNNRQALREAARKAEQLGYAARIVTTEQTGEARDVAISQIATLSGLIERTPLCLLWGGETTVTVSGAGKGGRNQELALSAALRLEPRTENVVFLSAGTDGVDGPTDAAGAWVSPATAPMARALGLDPEESLRNNDAYPFFDRLGALVKPGPTHTNVMDVQIALFRPPA